MKSFPSAAFAAALAVGVSLAPFRAGAEEKGDQVVIVTPPAVKATLTREAAGGAILSLERSDDSPAVYRATVKLDGREYVITVEAGGKLQRIEPKNSEEQEEPRLENFPAPAKAALTKFANGAAIEQADMQKQHTSYSIVIKQQDGKYRVTVDEQGKLLGKEPADD